MKVLVSNKKSDEEVRPVRGFIEAKDIKLLVFTNSNKQITKFELTLGKDKKTFTDAYPFIMWSQVENAIDAYLTSLAPQPKEDTKLKGVGKVRKGRKK